MKSSPTPQNVSSSQRKASPEPLSPGKRIHGLHFLDGFDWHANAQTDHNIGSTSKIDDALDSFDWDANTQANPIVAAESLQSNTSVSECS